jgi:anaerobic ribonucleoside-triphosphate reductase activating protein
MKPAHLISPGALAEQLLSNAEVTGLTISGGEPMLQADPLSRLVYEMRKIRPVNVICFSGYQLEQLRKAPPGPGVYNLLECIDVLIDGPYISRLNDDRGVRGSSNQRIHYLTDQLKGTNLEESPRKVEIMVHDGHAMLVGVPTRSLLNGLSLAMQRVQNLAGEGMLGYERA